MSKSILSLSRTFALSKENIFFAGVFDEWESYFPATRMFSFREHRKEGPWGHLDFLFHTARMCTYHFADKTYLIILSSEGTVYFHCMSNQTIKPYTEQIPEAGLNNGGNGRMLSVRQIGKKLYACGNNGQIYIRDSKDNWQMLTKDLLWDSDAYLKADEEAEKNMPDEEEDEEAYDAWEDAFFEYQRKNNPRYMLHDINGPTEDEIYICGEDGALFMWNGETLENLELDIEGALTKIHVADNGIVWICGRKGLLLSGNEEQGFDDHSDADNKQLFTAVTTYQGRVILASHVSPTRLFEFNPTTEEFTSITPDIEGPLETLYHVQAIDDVLWVVGSKDILRLQNDKWERINHPDISHPSKR